MKRTLIALVLVALHAGSALAADKPCDPAWATAKAFADHAAARAAKKAGCVCDKACACKPGACPNACPVATTPAVVVTPPVVVQPAAPACRTVQYIDRFGRVQAYTQCPLKN